MSEQQSSKLVSSLVEHQRYFSEMSTEDRQWAIQNTKDAIVLFVEAVKNRKTESAIASLVAGIFRLTVDYSQSLEQMTAAGRYDWKNDEITSKRFPITGKGVVEFEGRYFHFDRNISSENAIKEIEAEDTANPWSPAKIEHVLSHGKTFPEEQRKFPIVGLGSVALVYGRRCVPVLHEGGSGRYLYLNWFDDDWDPVCRFRAVRKVSAS